MKTVNDILIMRQLVQQWRKNSDSVGFVPTMGNLHEGHIALVTEAKKRCSKVVVSIFVNPMQFGVNEDLDSYPRTINEDSEKLAESGVDILFLPDTNMIYPSAVADQTQVNVPVISDMLCGLHRPGHFSGVSTVVCKLFNIVQPDDSWFGEKDYQQLAVIRKMVEDLNISTSVHSIATVREKSGLAKSSRNNYLSDKQRQLAPKIYQSLLKTCEQLKDKGRRDFQQLEQEQRDFLEDFEVEYVEILNLDLTKPEPDSDTYVVLLAAKLGNTRLIDNIQCDCRGL